MTKHDHNHYKIGCFRCSRENSFVLMAHRNDDGVVAGLLFVCTACFKDVVRQLADIRVSLKANSPEAGEMM
jgi:hypothetical protein